MSVAPNKIIEAVKKMGGSEEMANDLVEAVQSYVAESEQANQAKFKNILNKAKALCVEYVEQEILKNAQKLQVYIESKEREFSEFADRSRKLEESQAAVQLKKISSVLNGGNGSDVVSSVQLESLKKAQERLEKAYVALKEENMKLATASSRANTIAERAIYKAKTYRSLLAKTGLTEGVLEGGEEGSEVGSSGISREEHLARVERLKAGVSDSSKGLDSEDSEVDNGMSDDVDSDVGSDTSDRVDSGMVGESRRRRMRMIGESRISSQRPMTSNPMVGRPVSAQQSSDPVVNQIARNIAIDL